MVAIPWKFESSYPHHTLPDVLCVASQFWGCSSVDRALRSHRRGRGFESHQLHQKLKISLRGYGGMVDAEDLKSFGHCDRVGSSPTIPTKQIQHQLSLVFFYSCTMRIWIIIDHQTPRSDSIFYSIVFCATQSPMDHDKNTCKTT